MEPFTVTPQSRSPGSSASDAPSPQPRSPLFPLGDIVGTPGALALLRQYNLHPVRLLARHLHGDWGEVCAEDAAANCEAVTNEGRILSCYVMPGGERLWVITECDRSSTTMLCPDEH